MASLVCGANSVKLSKMAKTQRPAARQSPPKTPDLRRGQARGIDAQSVLLQGILDSLLTA